MIQNRLTKIDGLCLLNVLPVPVARRWQVVGVDSIYRPPPSNNDHILFITRHSKLSPDYLRTLSTVCATPCVNVVVPSCQLQLSAI